MVKKVRRETFVAPCRLAFSCDVRHVRQRPVPGHTACIEGARSTVNEVRAGHAQLPHKVRCWAFAPCWVGLEWAMVPQKLTSNTNIKNVERKQLCDTVCTEAALALSTKSPRHRSSMSFRQSVGLVLRVTPVKDCMRDALQWQTLCVLHNQVVSKDRYLRKVRRTVRRRGHDPLLGRRNQLRDKKHQHGFRDTKFEDGCAVLQYQASDFTHTIRFPTHTNFLGRSRPHQEHCVDHRPNFNSPAAIRPSVTQKKRKCMTRCRNGANEEIFGTSLR